MYVGEERTKDALRSVVGVYGRSTAWIVAPDVYLTVMRGPSRLTTSVDVKILLLRLWEILTERLRLTSVVSLDALFIATSENQRRVLWPIASVVEGRERPPLNHRVPQTRDFLVSLSRIPQLTRSLRDVDVPPATLHRICVLAAIAHAWTTVGRLILDAHQPAVVVAGTQHHTFVRAILHAARLRSTPSIYFPHAPVANNLAYLDLPFDLAGLRGPREVDFYVERNADPARLTVAGNPGVALAANVTPQPGPPVLAVPAGPTALVRQIVEFVRDATLGPVTVAPHPGSDHESLRRLLPAGWTLHEQGRTFDLLLERDAPVIQMSSGVAWEAAAVGRPVVQLDIQEGLNYPFISEPYVPHVSTSEELTSTIQSLQAEEAESPEIKDWAFQWCSAIGTEAAERARALIYSATQDPPDPGMALDGWSRRLGSLDPFV